MDGNLKYKGSIMRQIIKNVSSATNSGWVFVDSRRYTEQQIGFEVSLSQLATLTYDVEYTVDQNSKERWNNVSITRAAGVATVTLADHGLKVGDNVQLFDSNYTNHSPNTNFEGSFDVASVPTDDTFTIAVAASGDTTGIARAITFSVVDHPTVNGETTAQQGSFNPAASDDMPAVISGVRLNVTAYTDGAATLKVLQSG